MFSSCNIDLSLYGSNSTEEEFTYFTNKNFSSLKDLENELLSKWTEPDDIYKNCISFTFGRYSKEAENLASNSSVRRLLYAEGKQFVYDMGVTNHLINQDIVCILEQAGAFQINKYAICDSYMTDISLKRIGGPIYFEHSWWMYDNWDYNNSGEYGWTNSDVGKRILNNLSAYANDSDYSISMPDFYVTKDTYNAETFEFTGEAYAYVRVDRISNKAKAWRKYRYNMETKTITRLYDLMDIDHYKDVESSNLIHV